MLVKRNRQGKMFRVICLTIAVCMLLSLLPVTALAEYRAVPTVRSQVSTLEMYPEDGTTAGGSFGIAQAQSLAYDSVSALTQRIETAAQTPRGAVNLNLGLGRAVAERETGTFDEFFPDATLAQAVATRFYRAASDTVTSLELAALTGRLISVGGGISDLEGVQYLTGLTEIWLSNNAIQQLDPLAGLTGLRELQLSGNLIRNVQPLETMTQLTILKLDNNQIQNIDSLANMTQMTQLWLQNNRIENIDALVGMTSMQMELRISNNLVSDLTPVADMVGLRRLEAANNRIEDAAPLAALTNLTALHLGSNRLADVSALSALVSLEELNLWDNHIYDISPLSSVQPGIIFDVRGQVIRMDEPMYITDPLVVENVVRDRAGQVVLPNAVAPETATPPSGSTIEWTGLNEDVSQVEYTWAVNTIPYTAQMFSGRVIQPVVPEPLPPQQTIAFIANGGLFSLDPAWDFALTAEVGDTFASVFAEAEGLLQSRDGHIFQGWLRNGEIVPPDTYVTEAEDNLHVFTADWDLDETFVPDRNVIISFFGNGGAPTFQPVLVYVEGSFVQTYAEAMVQITEPARAHHVFAGWFTEPDGGDRIQSEDELDLDTPRMLFAQWDIDSMDPPPTQEVTVTFHGGAGAEPLLQEETIQIPYGQTRTYADVFAEIQTPTRENVAGTLVFHFIGWFTEQEGGQQIFGVETLTVDRMLHARWLEIPIPPALPSVQAVIFQSNGGTGNAQVHTTTVGGTYELVFEAVNEPVFEGHDFIGWFDSDGVEVLYSDYVTPEIFRELFAHWTPVDGGDDLVLGGDDPGLGGDDPGLGGDDPDLGGDDPIVVQESQIVLFFAIDGFFIGDDGNVNYRAVRVSMNATYGEAVAELNATPVPENGDERFRGWFNDPRGIDAIDLDASIQSTMVRVVFADFEPIDGPDLGGDDPVPGGDDPVPGGDDPVPGGDDPVPGGDDPVPGGDDPVPGGDDPVPGGDDPVPGGDDPVPGGDDPVPGGDDPVPGGEGPAPDEVEPASGGVFPLTTEHHAYLLGFGDETIRPHQTITRAEIATIFFRLMDDGYRENLWAQSNPFWDVQLGDWFNNAISTTTNAGLFNGLPDGSFRPRSITTRGEFAMILSRFADVSQEDEQSSFDDTEDHWAEDAVGTIQIRGWVTPWDVDGGAFRADEPVTRAEVAYMINQMLGRNLQGTDALIEGMATWVDNSDPSAWYFLALQEASNSTDFERLPNGEIRWTELWPTLDLTILERPESQPSDMGLAREIWEQQQR